MYFTGRQYGFRRNTNDTTVHHRQLDTARSILFFLLKQTFTDEGMTDDGRKCRERNTTRKLFPVRAMNSEDDDTFVDDSQDTNHSKRHNLPPVTLSGHRSRPFATQF